MKSIIYIGMDVHKNSYNLCAYDQKTGEILSEVRCNAEAKNIKKFIDNIKKNHGEDIEIKTGYEAGCLGYSLHNQLLKYGIACDILAPTTMYSAPKNGMVKNDKLDARSIATNLANKTYKPVYVPDEEDVATKEYLRMRQDFKKSLKIVKQQIKALVLRHGYIFNGGTAWTNPYLKWLNKLEMQELLRETLDEYLLQYNNLTDKIERFTARIEEISHNDKYEKSIAQLRCFKGIDTQSAMILHVEISDFLRFPNAKAFASYVGLNPGERSSGDKVKYTGISKQGNCIVRTTLVENAQTLVRGTVGQKGWRLKARQEGQNSMVIDYADRAVERLQRKYHQLIKRGVNRNKAIAAVARELACFVWGMEVGKIGRG